MKDELCGTSLSTKLGALGYPIFTKPTGQLTRWLEYHPKI